MLDNFDILGNKVNILESGSFLNLEQAFTPHLNSLMIIGPEGYRLVSTNPVELIYYGILDSFVAERK